MYSIEVFDDVKLIRRAEEADAFSLTPPVSRNETDSRNLIKIITFPKIILVRSSDRSKSGFLMDHPIGKKQLSIPSFYLQRSIQQSLCIVLLLLAGQPIRSRLNVELIFLLSSHLVINIPQTFIRRSSSSSSSSSPAHLLSRRLLPTSSYGGSVTP